MGQRHVHKRLIRLAENPLEVDEEPVDELLGDEEEYGGDEVEGGMYRGRRMSGPRTKLAARLDTSELENRLGDIEKALTDQSETVLSLARSVAKLVKALPIRKQDEDEDEDEDEKEEKALRKARTRKAHVRKEESDFQPYGGEQADEEPESDHPEEETAQEPGLVDMAGAAEVGKAKRGKGGRFVSKDDAASSFGEKDEDIPGNRPVVPDDKEKEAGEYLIQGEAGDGPGPVSKAVQADIQKAVDGILAKHGIIRKAAAPRVGSSQVETGDAPDMDAMFDKVRGMSFREIAQLRIASGELSGSAI